jgi:hypothetical protein
MNNSSRNTATREHPYFDQPIVLTSKHQKLILIQPAFQEIAGLTVVEQDLDTDLLGTFSGEVERAFPPLETAIRKAELGLINTGGKLGLASEGSIGSDPLIPFAISNIEHLVLVDKVRGIVISESFRSFEIVKVSEAVAPGEDLEQLLFSAGFPEQKLIAKSNQVDGEGSLNPIKAISNRKSLLDAIAECARQSKDGKARIEPDYRAHSSPSRAKNIIQVAEMLATRISRLCPTCNCPGWGKVCYDYGLSCEACDTYDLTAVRQEVLGCVSCDQKLPGVVLATNLRAENCQQCNP